MTIVEKEAVWEKIKEETTMNFTYKEEVFNLIDEHVDRIEFIKDHIGLRDFLFLAETDTQFTSDLFVALNTRTEKNMNVMEKEMAFMEKYNDHPEEVLKQLEEFFTYTNRPLYVGIGFSETSATEEQEISVLLDLHKGEIESIQEGLKNIRQFPIWYDRFAKMPEEIHFLSRTEERKQIMGKVNELLDKEQPTDKDKEFFKQLARQLKNI